MTFAQAILLLTLGIIVSDAAFWLLAMKLRFYRALFALSIAIAVIELFLLAPFGVIVGLLMWSASLGEPGFFHQSLPLFVVDIVILALIFAGLLFIGVIFFPARRIFDCASK